MRPGVRAGSSPSFLTLSLPSPLTVAGKCQMKGVTEGREQGLKEAFLNEQQTNERASKQQTGHHAIERRVAASAGR